MTMRHTWIAGVLAAAAFVPLARADKVYKKSGGAPVEGFVTEESVSVIKVKKDGFISEIKAEDVDRVEREPVTCPEYIRAWKAFQERNFADAAESFEKASNSGKKDPWTRTYALFYAAECYRHLGASSKDAGQRAVDAYNLYLKENPNHLFLNGARSGRIECLIQVGNMAEADKAVSELLTAGLAGCALARVKLLQAQILERQDKFKEAAAKYKDLTSQGRDCPDVSGAAGAGVGRCLKDPEERLEWYKSLIQRSTHDQSLASAFNGLGDSYLEKKNFEEAVWNFLHVVVIPGMAAYDEELAHALCGAGEAFEGLGQKTRAGQLLDQAAAMPGPWGDRARKRLGK
ncbi:MAG: tetratricopeptide repeat protein [Planctomycetota bacterium]